MTSSKTFVKPERTRDAQEIRAERKRTQRTGRPQPVQIDAILPNPWQPRHNINSADLRPLAESIRNYGFIGHLEVRTDPFTQQPQLVYGHRRLEAARLAGEKTLPALTVEYSDEEMIELALLENVTAMGLSPWEEAQQMDLIRKNLQLSVRGLAEFMGVNKGWVENRLSLLESPEHIRDLLREGQIEMTVAILVNRMLKKGVAQDEIDVLLQAYLDNDLNSDQFREMQFELIKLRKERTDEEGKPIHTVSIAEQVAQRKLKEKEEEDYPNVPAPEYTAAMRMAERMKVSGDTIEHVKAAPLLPAPQTPTPIPPRPMTGHVPAVLAEAYGLPAQENRTRLDNLRVREIGEVETVFVPVNANHSDWHTADSRLDGFINVLEHWTRTVPENWNRIKDADLDPMKRARLLALRDQVVEELGKLS